MCGLCVTCVSLSARASWGYHIRQDPDTSPPALLNSASTRCEPLPRFFQIEGPSAPALHQVGSLHVNQPWPFRPNKTSSRPRARGQKLFQVCFGSPQRPRRGSPVFPATPRTARASRARLRPAAYSRKSIAHLALQHVPPSACPSTSLAAGPAGAAPTRRRSPRPLNKGGGCRACSSELFSERAPTQQHQCGSRTSAFKPWAAF